MELYRRVRPDQVVEDKNTGELRPSSAVFRDPSMSVDVAEFLREDGLDHNWSLREFAGYSLARFTAAYARSKQQTVVHTPIIEDPANPYHAEVVGHKTPGTARQMSKDVAWAHLEPKS